MMRISDVFKQKKRGDGSSKARESAPEQQQAPQVAKASSEIAPEATPEEFLRQFDLASKYGPCTGLTRLERWERAQKLGLQPPARVKTLLEAAGTGSPLNLNIWHGRV